MMKIVQVNTSDIQGGAARAAYRLHRGLIALGQSSRLLAVHKQSTDETVLQIQAEAASDRTREQQLAMIQNSYINGNRTTLSNTSFSLPYPGFDLTHLPVVQAADVINLHWIAYYQSPATLKQLSALGKPIVWTLHDMWAFTGGCHYSAGCDRYQHNCVPCPQLSNDPYCLPEAILQDRLEFLTEANNVVIVTPSHWLADCARRSRVFQKKRIEVIPYSLDTEIFKPLPKEDTKQQLGISLDTLTILVGADNGNEQRKGFAQLLQALKICLNDPQFNKLVQQKKVNLLCFGIPHTDLAALSLPIHALGQIESDQRLSQVYSAADLFVLPSLEDNFPNTMLEAMGCGTPVVAFNVGGIPDLVQDGITGRIVPWMDVAKLANAILDCVFNTPLRQGMGQHCRKVMESSYSLTVQAEHYRALYQDILQSTSMHKAFNSGVISQLLAIEATNTSLSAPIDTTLGTAFRKKFYATALESVTRELQYTQHHLQHTQAQVEQLKSQLQQAYINTEQLNTYLLQTQTGFDSAQARITAMETSKFWKLREAWFRIKRMLGLPVKE